MGGAFLSRRFYCSFKSAMTALFISSVTIAEISYGLHTLPDSKRRSLLETRFELFISQAFAQRVLSFNERTARIYGEIMGYRKELGRPISVLDGQIAAIALANNMDLATRNIKDYTDCGLKLINPFNRSTKSIII